MGTKKLFWLALGKSAGLLSRKMKAGGGTTFPGKLVRILHPGFVPEMIDSLSLDCVLVTGTNGKTTTSTMIAKMLEKSRIAFIHNRTGANLMSGIASAIIREVGLGGDECFSLGLFEVDEGTVPEAVRETKPSVVVINNLFRDQLDRYGELDTLAAKMRSALLTLERNDRVILNADDPLVASLGDELSADAIFFGIEAKECASTSMQHAADSKYCVYCGERLQYSYYIFGHLGDYRCPGCGKGRRPAQVRALEIDSLGLEGSRIRVATPYWESRLTVPLPGLYNVYNALAAVTCGISLGIDPEIIREAVEEFSPAFGRVERIAAGDKTIVMILAKNPAGFNEVIRTLEMISVSSGRLGVLLALNDNVADGRDVSWIWDVDLEKLCSKLSFVVCSGIRAWDMALRVKYGELSEDWILVEPNLQKALDSALEKISGSGTLYLVPTYTAMLEIRDMLARRGLVSHYWE